MHKPRIIFFDIDGTLIDMEKKRITERTLDALRRLQQNGNPAGRRHRAFLRLIVPKFDGVEFDVLSHLQQAPTATTVAEIFLSAPSHRRMCRR